MHIFKASISALIVPLPVEEFGEITGGGRMYLKGMNVKHECGSYSEYINQMSQSEIAFKEVIENIIRNNN